MSTTDPNMLDYKVESFSHNKKINKKHKRVIFREGGLVFPTPTTGNVNKGNSKAEVL